MLSPLQQDALKEFMNIYIGQAASLLGEMVNEKINLTIPQVQLISLLNTNDSGHFLPLFLKGHVISSSIRFGTQFSGKARLVFPVDKTKLLVSLCMGEDNHEEISIPSKLTDTDFDAIKEIGNIILNAILGGLGNLMKTKLEYSLPEIELLFFPEDHNQSTMSSIQFPQESYVLVILNTFHFDKTHIEGAVLVVLSINSVSLLMEKINEILEEVYE